jgi:hypothetical protein
MVHATASPLASGTSRKLLLSVHIPTTLGVFGADLSLLALSIASPRLARQARPRAPSSGIRGLIACVLSLLPPRTARSGPCDVRRGTRVRASTDRSTARHGVLSAACHPTATARGNHVDPAARSVAA